MIRIAVEVGSSPQVRGKQNPGLVATIITRLIPAGAGKTSLWRAYRRMSAAHPRRCGENVAVNGELGYPCGSSPQVRGKPV